MYLILFIIFLVAMYFFTQKNKDFFNKISGMDAAMKMGGNGATPGGTSGATQEPLNDLAQALNFTYTPIAKNTEKKELWAMGGRMKGDYKGKNVELVMETRGVEAGLVEVNTSHRYTMENRVTMKVENPNGKKFEIMPKSSNITSAPTGDAAFDEKFTLTGDQHPVSDELKNFAKKTGWLHMKLSGSELTMIDDYFQQPEFTSVTGAMKMMSAVHPIWGTSAQKTKIEQSRVTDLLDQMLAVANAL